MIKLFDRILSFFLRYSPRKALVHLELRVAHSLGKGSGGGGGYTQRAIEVKNCAQFLMDFEDTNNRKVVIFDIGSNDLQWSKAALAMWPHSEIHAFDPIPLSEESKRVLENSNGKITFTKIALGSENANRTFYEPKVDNSLSSFADISLLISGDFTAREEEVVTLDSLYHRGALTVPDLVKLDVEGWESEVLLGARLLLHATKVIQFEISPATLMAGSSLFRIHQLLSSLEFEVFRMEPRGLCSIGEPSYLNENFRVTNFLAKKRITQVR